jgi:hypothetical protein
MIYRTKTYIAAEWTGDHDAVKQIHKWNDGKKWSLSFTDAHELTQARDGSLYCSIKSSLGTRLDATKTFILIVGINTKSARSGSCQYCKSNNVFNGSCAKGYSIDYRSYIEYECEKALKAALKGQMKIIVLYKAAKVNKSNCPVSLKNIGKHVAMYYIENGNTYYDYQALKDAIG